MSGMFSEVFGKKDKSVPVDDLILRIDAAIDNLSVRSNKDINNEDNLITKSVTDLLIPDFDAPTSTRISSTNKADTLISGLDPIFKDLAVPEERTAKYKVYDTIYNNVQVIKKIVTVYLDNIFQKDSISNKVILIKEVDKDKSAGNIDEYKKFAEKFIEFFNVDERLRGLVFKSLKYGDGYIEYINLDDIEDDFPKVREQEAKNFSKMREETPHHYNSTLVSESADIESIKESVNSKYKSSKNEGNFILDDLEIDKLSNILFEFGDKNILKDSNDIIFNYINESSEDKQKKRKVTKQGNKKKIDPKKRNMAGIALRYHGPHKIIPIVSEYDNILGYVEVKTIEKQATQTYNPTLGFADIIKKVSSLRGGKDSRQKYEKTLKLFANSIAKRVIAKYKVFYDPTQETQGNKKQMDDTYQKQVKSVLDDELYYSLKRILLDTGVNNLFYKKLSVRFIPVDKMFKFSISNSSSYPFGESIIDPLVYPAKLYLLTQLSNIVTKLSRSSIIRKWTVDIGSRENESDILNRLKKQIRNQKITASDLTSSKEIPRLLSDFRDFVCKEATSYSNVCRITL